MVFQRRRTYQPQIETLEDRRTPANLPSGFAQVELTDQLSQPTAMQFAPDGRIFVAEQGGTLRVIKDGTLLPTPFVSLNVDPNGERGVLGVAVDPDFANNGFVYVYYSVNAVPRHNRVSRFTAAGDVAQSGSELVLMDLDNLNSLNHNGGALNFGLDGKLYIATGENQTSSNAQSLNTVLGKILRIDPDGNIPDDNPFYNQTTDKNRAIWALGLRNPFTTAVQPGTGRIFINDVGQNTWEEINEGAAGANFGWPTYEGNENDPSFADPIFAYAHGDTGTTGCAITGGTFYNPGTDQFPAAYVGDYFFSDYCNGWIRRFDPTDSSVTGFATGIDSPVDLKVGPDGSLYYISHWTGSVWRVSYADNGSPTITDDPDSQTIPEGESVTFTVAASGAPTLHYQWQRDGVDIPGETGTSFTINQTTATDDGAKFRAVVTNNFGTATSQAATLHVTLNQRPTATITQPAVGTHYTAGDTITFAGFGTDPEDGSLADSNLSWWVDFHHDQHTHPFMPETSGSAGGTFDIPTLGETSANVWYRIHLRVVDSDGLTHETYRDVLPNTATLQLFTSPKGLQVNLDGQPRATPFTFDGVAGMMRTLDAPALQDLNGVTWVFDSWSDGGAAQHDISTPSQDTTFTAVFRVSGGTVGTGNGLAATYYDNANLTGSTVERIDPTVGYRWRQGSPDAAIGIDTFSARWIGWLEGQFSEKYSFYVSGNDGMRLWLDGKLIINAWNLHAGKSKPVLLNVGEKHAIVLEMREKTGSASARLQWGSPSTPRSIVSSSQLYPIAGALPGPWAHEPVGGATGAAAFMGGTFAVSSGGLGFAGTTDDFTFVYQQLIGDFDLAAGITTIQRTGLTAFAGLMARTSLAADAMNTCIGLTAAGDGIFQSRSSTGGDTQSTVQPAGTMPRWLRLNRQGDLLTGYQSEDGTNWTEMSHTTLSLGDPIFVGLAVSSNRAGYVNTSLFDQVVLV